MRWDFLCLSTFFTNLIHHVARMLVPIAQKSLMVTADWTLALLSWLLASSCCTATRVLA